MIDLIARRDMIRDRMTEFVETELGLQLRVLEPQEWVTTVEGPNKMFGYDFPMFEPGSEEITIQVCPDVISASTSPLNDDFLDIYLDIVEFVIARHVVHFETVEDPDERARMVDDDLWNMRPDAMKFFSETQMKALDMLSEDDD